MTELRTWKIGGFEFVEVDFERKIEIKSGKRTVATLEFEAATLFQSKGWYIATTPMKTRLARAFTSARAAAKWFVSPDGDRCFIEAVHHDLEMEDRYEDWYDDYVSSGEAYRDAARWQATSKGGLY